MLQLELKKLQGEIWDLHKDVYGFRPRHWKDSDWQNLPFLQAQYADLLKKLDNWIDTL